jgi:hypothetical protein
VIETGGIIRCCASVRVTNRIVSPELERHSCVSQSASGTHGALM